MDQNTQEKESLLVQQTSQMSYEELANLVESMQDQLASLDYRVTNKNFGSKLYQSKQTIASKGRLVAGNKDDVAILDGQNPTWRLWVGTEEPTTAPFRVDKDGNVVASSITLTGYVQTGGAAADVNANATTISGSKITTGSLDASKITAGTITATQIQSGSITTNKLLAGEIVGFTVTGGIVRTASSGTRVELSSNQIAIYNGSTLRAIGYQSGWTYYNTSGATVADIFADTSSYGSKSLFITASGVAGGNLIHQTNSSGTFAIYNGSQQAAYWSQYNMYSFYNIDPASSDLYLGGNPYSWRRLYLDSVGYVTSGGGEGNPFPVQSGWSVTKLATGRYRVNHPLSSILYSVVIVPVASTVKNSSIEDRSSGSFTVRIANLSDVLEDNDFMFIVIMN